MPEWFKFVLIALQVSIVLLVLAIGIRTTWAEAIFLFQNPELLFKSLLARNVVMPLVAILLVKAFSIHSAVKLSIVLLSVTPIPPLLPRTLEKAGARASYACGLLVSHSVLAILLVPLTVEVLNLVFVAQAHFGPLAVAKTVVMFILVPLATGMVIGRFLRNKAPRIARAVGAVGNILLLLAFLPTLVLLWQTVQIVAGNGALLALALFILAGLVAGHLLGGPRAGDRTALAVATASRHPGLAIAIAIANFPGQGKLVIGVVLIYLVLNLTLPIPYIRWRRRALGVAGNGTPLPVHP